MVRIAITPDNISVNVLINSFDRLRRCRADLLYLRAHFDAAILPGLVTRARTHGLMPLVRLSQAPYLPHAASGIHLTASEHSCVEQAHALNPAVITVSCHQAETVDMVLAGGADYAMLSPVYRPLSKPDDLRPTLSLPTLQALAAQWSGRLVLLGGLTEPRIRHLAQLLPAPVSVAGISLFFPA